MHRCFVAGAALCDEAFRDVLAGAAFCDIQKVLFRRITVAGTYKYDMFYFSNIVASAAFRECLEKWCKLRESHVFFSSVKISL